MDLEQASVSRNYVMSGDILCSCGHHAKIERGIVKTGNHYIGKHDTPDLGCQLYGTLCNEMLKAYQSCCNYITDEFQRIDLNGKTVLEGYINGYFYLYNYFQQLPRNCVYVITDKYPEMLLMYKELIERLNLKLDILYIADNTAELPLAEQSVDVCVDFFSSTEWSLYQRDEYPHAMSRFFAPKCQIVGSFIDVPPFSCTKKNLQQKYPEGNPDLYCFSILCDSWRREGFTLTSQLCSHIKKTQNSFSFTCHVDGDDLCIYTYHAQRMGQKGSLPIKK